MTSILRLRLSALFLCAYLISFVRSESSTSTMLQLRESVEFSYCASNVFLDLIRGSKPPTEVFKAYTNIMSAHNNRVSYRTIQPVIISYVGFGICTVIGILFAVFMPIVGLIFCCARCCGKCGGRAQLMDAKKDPCRRIAYTVCLAVLVTLQLVAVVLAFINHFLLHEALVSRNPQTGAFSQFNLSLTETEVALNDMYKMAVNTSSINIDDRKERFIGIVDKGLLDFQKEFARKSHSELVTTPIVDLQKTVGYFAMGSENVVFLSYYNQSLVKLLQDLPSLRQALVDTLDTSCPIEQHIKCRQLMNEAQTKLKTQYSIDQFQFTDVEVLLQNLETHLNDVKSLSEFNSTLGNLATVVKDAIQADLDRAWKDLAQSPETREKLAKAFGEYVKDISAHLATIRQNLEGVQNYEGNEPLLRVLHVGLYGGIALLCIPVLIILLLYLGLCFGVCGHRPYEEAGVCNRGVGANLLLAGVGFIFLFSTLLMLVCMVLFLAGGPVQTEVCRYLTGRVPDGPRKLDDYVYESIVFLRDTLQRDKRLREQTIEQLRQQGHNEQISVRYAVDNPEFELALDVSRARLGDAILTRCETEPFVDAISGGEFSWPPLREPVQAILQDLIDSFKNVNLISPLEQTVRSCQESLERLKFMDAVNFTSAINRANIPLTLIEDLEHFAVELRSLNMEELRPHIDTLSDLPLSLDQQRVRVRHLYTMLDSFLGQHHLIQRRLSEFNANLSESVKVTMDVGLQKLRPVFEKELQLAVIATWRDIPCKSLRAAVKRGVDAGCITLLMPMNAFWTGLGFTLLLYIPVIIFAVKLAGLYRKTEKYSSDYEEPDYISYHGFYMRPTSEYQVVSQKPRNKVRKHKVKNASNGRNPPNNRGGSRYHQVSVYPYDAYE
ncbi:unnamed protein product [Calicophoron daubneyi]|uniref:Prominin-like protein n=1 Tax=Calicophoron daubneyi TaxID=300641 RepID=A0AAV2T135_CALDB